MKYRLVQRLYDHGDPASITAQFRRRRLEAFTSHIVDLPRPVSILDVGGSADFWATTPLTSEPWLKITLLNVGPQPSRPGFDFVLGDARSMPEHADASFDVVFSNSVIEHLGTWDNQLAMARETRRVGKRYWIQTPYRYCPVDPHFLYPGMQFLPKPWQARILHHASITWNYPSLADARRLVDEIRLLDVGEMGALFPGCTVLRERVAGFTKSLIAIGGWGASRGT